MRVVLIGHYQVPHPFSEHRLDYPMLKMWAAQMERLAVIVQGSRSTSDAWRDGNLVIHYAPFTSVTRTLPGFVVWASREVLKIHRQAPIDIVNGSDLWGGFIGITLRPLVGAKVLAQLQGEFLPPSRLFYSVFAYYLLAGVAQFVCRKADMVRCLYNAAAEKVVALGVPRQKIAVLPSRCDINLFSPKQFPLKNVHGRKLLYVGNLIEGKGVHYLLKALTGVVRDYQDTILTIVGGGPQEKALKSMTENLGLTSHVVFMGRKPHYELPAIMHEADLFVFPSLSEATPRAILEAMAMELPVVATRVGGLPEMIEDGRTGLLVEPANPHQLAGAIFRGLNDPIWAIEAGRLGRKRVLENYTLEQHIQRMIALHYHVLGMNSGAWRFRADRRIG